MNENAIEIKNLTKRRGNFAIDDLSLTLPNGCIMGLVGENGAGKTTLIRLILGALRKDGGSIAVLGKESGGKDFYTVREDIGVVPDEIGFPYSMNAKLVGSVMRRTYKKWDEALYEKYLADMSEGAVSGKRESPYGAEALVRRDLLPEGLPVSNVSLEELFVFMVKGNGATKTTSFEEDLFA